MNTSQPLRFNYKFTVTSAVWMVLLTLFVTAALAYTAYSTPDVRLVRLLSQLFSPEIASMIFWGMAVLCLFATFLAIKFAFSAKALNYVELGPDGAYVPSATMSMTPITIPYKAIKNIQIVNFNKQQIAVISSTVGESRLLAKFFDQPSHFTTFLLGLEQRRRS